MHKLHLSLIMDDGISVYLHSEIMQCFFLQKLEFLIILFAIIHGRNKECKKKKRQKKRLFNSDMFLKISYNYDFINVQLSAGAWLDASSQMKIEL